MVKKQGSSLNRSVALSLASYTPGKALLLTEDNGGPFTRTPACLLRSKKQTGGYRSVDTR